MEQNRDFQNVGYFSNGLLVHYVLMLYNISIYYFKTIKIIWLFLSWFIYLYKTKYLWNWSFTIQNSLKSLVFFFVTDNHLQTNRYMEPKQNWEIKTQEEIQRNKESIQKSKMFLNMFYFSNKLSI